MLSEGEHLLDVNGANQWLGVFGADRETAPLLVLHGGPGANNWVFQQSVAREISHTRTVVLHEQRGCGRSRPAPPACTYTMDTLITDIAAVIDVLQVDQVDLLGWSFGADLASRVLLQRPERIRRLVLQAPALDFADDVVPTYLLANFEKLATPEVARAVARVVHGPGTPWERLDRLWPVIDQATADRVGYHQPDKARLASRLHDEFGIDTNMDVMRALVGDRPDLSIMERLHVISCPTLVITGAHDHNVDPCRADRIARAIPKSRMVTFAEAAHMPHLEEPQSYVEHLVDFLT